MNSRILGQHFIREALFAKTDMSLFTEIDQFTDNKTGYPLKYKKVNVILIVLTLWDKYKLFKKSLPSFST